MNDNDGDDDHVLSDFLRERLPQVGLEYDTYGPYVLPLLTDEEIDNDEWDSVLELLQASSESHSDDEEVWKVLRHDIEAAWAQHCAVVREHEAQQKQAQAHELERALAEERRQAEEAQAEAEQAKKQAATASSTETDASKQALLERFGYDRGDQDAEAGDDNGAVVTNQQAAAAAQEEKRKDLRAQKGQATKREEQQKTNQAKKDKLAIKEERRKRAVKGERRRG